MSLRSGLRASVRRGALWEAIERSQEAESPEEAELYPHGPQRAPTNWASVVANEAARSKSARPTKVPKRSRGMQALVAAIRDAK
jgi:hypothetical protein